MTRFLSTRIPNSHASWPRTRAASDQRRGLALAEPGVPMATLVEGLGLDLDELAGLVGVTRATHGALMPRPASTSK